MENTFGLSWSKNCAVQQYLFPVVSKYFWPNFGIQLLPIVQVRGLNYFTVSEAISLKESRWTYKLQTIIFFAIIRDSEINLGSR